MHKNLRIKISEIGSWDFNLNLGKIFAMDVIGVISQSTNRNFTLPQPIAQWQGRKVVHILANVARGIGVICLIMLCAAILWDLFRKPPTSRRPPPTRPVPTQPVVLLNASAIDASFKSVISSLALSYGLTSKDIDGYFDDVLIPRGIQSEEDLVPIFAPIVGIMQILNEVVQFSRSQREEIAKLRESLKFHPNRKLPMGQGVVFELQRIPLNARYAELIQMTEKYGGDAAVLRLQQSSLKLTQENWEQEVNIFKGHLAAYEKALTNPHLKKAQDAISGLRSDHYSQTLRDRLKSAEIPTLATSEDLEPFLRAVFLSKYILQADILLAWKENLMPYGITTLNLLLQMAPLADVFEIGLNRKVLLQT